MKKSKVLLLSAAAFGLVLTGCNGTSSVTSGGTSSADSILNTGIDTSSTDGYAAGRDFFTNYMAAEKDYDTGMFTSHGEAFMPNKGYSKLLVVPVIYSDNSSTDAELATNKSCLEKAFFGEASDTTWQSVRSYYYESSYHQLYFTGEVTDAVKLDETYSALTSSKVTTIYNNVVEEVYDKLFYNDGAPLKGKEADYDSNGDGVIDGIYMVPDSPVDSSKDLGWAFTTRHGYLSKRQALKSPRYETIGTYCWTSIDFAFRVPSEGGSVAKPDSHTFIHEMGHQLGLNDYYDPNTQQSGTAGGSTMQDENICDHDPYSKYLWGWTSPKVVTDKNTESSISVSLKPFEDSGDCLVLAPGFNGTAMDEYLMIEYYTPTGLNAHDVAKSYEGDSQQGVDASGIRIWHVDKNLYEAHMGKAENDKGVMTDTTFFDQNPVSTVVTEGAANGYALPDDISPDDDSLYNSEDSKNQDDDFYTSMTTNNSKYRSDSYFYIQDELRILRADEGEATSGSAVMTKDTLFEAGDTFGTASDAFGDFEFYSPSVTLDYDCDGATMAAAARIQLPYSIKVETVTDTAATLTLTRI